MAAIWIQRSDIYLTLVSYSVLAEESAWYYYNLLFSTTVSRKMWELNKTNSVYFDQQCNNLVQHHTNFNKRLLEMLCYWLWLAKNISLQVHLTVLLWLLMADINSFFQTLTKNEESNSHVDKDPGESQELHQVVHKQVAFFQSEVSWGKIRW